MQQQAQTAVQARRAWENSRRDLKTMNERTMGSFLWKQMPRQDRLRINRGGGDLQPPSLAHGLTNILQGRGLPES